MIPRMASAVVSAVAAVALLAGCPGGDAASQATVTYTPPAPAAPASPAYDPAVCAQIEAQQSVNAELAQGGYAQSYSDQYEALKKASGCP